MRRVEGDTAGTMRADKEHGKTAEPAISRQEDLTSRRGVSSQ